MSNSIVIFLFFLNKFNRFTLWFLLLFFSCGISASSINECDHYALDPLDYSISSNGVLWENIEVRKAIYYCADAVKIEPNNLRVKHQLLRSGLHVDSENYVFNSIVSELEKNSSMGYVPSKILLSKVYLDKNYGRVNVPLAYRYAKEAWFAGSYAGLRQMGIIKINCYTDEFCDVNDGLQYIKLSSENGDYEAQFYLGVMYFSGNEEMRDKSMTLMRMSAEGGNTLAMLNLYYRFSDYTSEFYNNSYAKYWLNQAVKSGDGVAKKILNSKELEYVERNNE